MKIYCPCGNVLRDQTDFIPFKARLIPDEDIDNLADAIAVRDAQGKAPQDCADAYSIVLDYSRCAYQCQNCGRLFIAGADGRDELQVFRPDTDAWQKVFASTKGERRYPWLTNIVAHWDPRKEKGELWFDPPPEEKGGYEVFLDRAMLERRYYELIDLMHAKGDLRGARFGVGVAGQPIHDVHSWRAGSS